MVRGFPSTVTVKSAGVRSLSGWKDLSTTVTSIQTTSTPDLNVGGGCCAARPASAKPTAGMRRTCLNDRRR
jgi:hypothetical protein